MKKEDLPQDKSGLKDFTREVCYVRNKEGHYEKGLSTGWDVKTDALSEAWEEISRRVKEAQQAILTNEKSPILFFMELNLMDFPTLAGYTGFFQFSIKRHLKPAVFQKLSERKLSKYAQAFRVSVEELKQFDANNIEQYLSK